MFALKDYNSIYEYYDSKTIYIKHHSGFDLIIDEIFNHNILCIDSINEIDLNFSYGSIIFHDKDIFIHHNSIINKIDNKILNKNHNICFIHNAMNNIKKEDKIIWEKNITNVDVINFMNRPYGIPYHGFRNTEAKKDILVIHKGYDISFLKTFKIENIASTNVFKSFNDMISTFSQYKIICSFDTADSIIAESVGCHHINLGTINKFEILGAVAHLLDHKKAYNNNIFIDNNIHMLTKDIINENNIKTITL